jgi:hypothetical protein
VFSTLLDDMLLHLRCVLRHNGPNKVVLGRLMGLIRSVAVSALLKPLRSSMSIRAWKPRATVAGILYRRSMLSAPLLASAVCMQYKAKEDAC